MFYLNITDKHVGYFFNVWVGRFDESETVFFKKKKDFCLSTEESWVRNLIRATTMFPHMTHTDETMTGD